MENARTENANLYEFARVENASMDDASTNLQGWNTQLRET